jgi:Flp pilus assembly protein TadG
VRARLQRALRGRETGGERGFVTVFVALTLTVLLIFAAFTVDFGSWYARSAQLKRAADAAALAGVVWMPEFTEAQDAAVAAAARNGFVNNVNNIKVQVEDVPGNNRQLKVTIADTKAKQFFSRLVTQSQSIGRSSTAEYVLPVPLGSPENAFGTGNLSLTGQATTQNFWAAINGYCAGRESGDPRSAFWESYTNSNGNGCNNSSDQSDTYTPDGYLYAIDVPTSGQSLNIQVYDGSFNTSGSPMDKSLGGDSDHPQSVTTIYTIYNRNPTPLDASPENLATLQRGSPITVSTNDDSYQTQWKTLATIPSAAAGRYYVRVQTPVQTTNSRGSNGYALRAYSGASSNVCSTLTSSTCPQLFALDAMSIYANIQGSSPTFYLASIDPIHAGKTMRIKLFDIGEGAQKLRIIGPNGTAQPFTWSTACDNPPAPATGGCSGSASGSDPYLDVSGSGTQPYTGLNSSSKYSDRTLTIDIPLIGYNPPAGNYWWKVQYTVDSGSPPTDRTTWETNIVGDPVHLLQ